MAVTIPIAPTQAQNLGHYLMACFWRAPIRILALGAGLGTATQAGANDDVWQRAPLSFKGVPGLIDMPTAHARPDADVGLTLSAMDSTGRAALFFQLTPRLSGAVRYTAVDDLFGAGTFYDRSFDLSYLLVEEGPYRPAVSIGFQGLGGSGVYTSEYLVASKTFGRLRATAGLGWGRLGSYNGFDSPWSDTRPRALGNLAQTGQVDYDQWFKGDIGLFAGLQYAVNDRFFLTAEYSSDNYTVEQNNIGFERSSPVNVGLTYRFRNGLDVSAAYLYGTTAAVNLTYNFNAKDPNAFPGGRDAAPPPVRQRASAQELGWGGGTQGSADGQARVEQLLAEQGLQLDGYRGDAREVRVRIRNDRYTSSAQAVGRAARVLSNAMPDSVESFVIIPVADNGLVLSRVVINRSDLEDLEYAPDGTWQSFARARIENSGPRDTSMIIPEGAFPKLDWGIAPYFSSLTLDPTTAGESDIGVEGRLRFEPINGLVFDASVRQRLLGDPGAVPASNSALPRVRTDAALYAEQGGTNLNTLTMSRYFRLDYDLYGRATVGYLERMYAGVSGEILWKPVDSRLAVGAELNYVQQREFDGGFGLQDYNVVTGHLSAYFQGKHGFHYQVDVGRYLAGDVGATFSVDREFNNGIKIGAFATITDADFSEFGPGSFDKGLRVSIPLSVLTGRASETVISPTIRPVQRDGGARLEVNGRLYESIRQYHEPGLQDQWGRFWR